MLFLFTHYYSYQFILNTMMGYTFIKLSRSTRFLYPTICSRLICYGLFFSAFVYFARSPTSLLMFWAIFFSVRVFRPFSHFIAYVLGYFFPHSYISPVLPLHCLCFGLFFSAFIYFAHFFMYPSLLFSKWVNFFI